MHTDPYLLPVTTILFFLLMSTVVLHYFRQSSVIAYLIAGVLIGPSGFSLVTDKSLMGHLGSFGVVFLLFFVGLEIDIKEILKNWKISLLGTFLQILFSLLVILGIGYLLNWTYQRAIFFAFAMSLSSTAVVIQYLKENDLLTTQIGKDVLGILIAQDIALIPMLIIIGLFDQAENQMAGVTTQLSGAFLLCFIVYLAQRNSDKKFKILNILKKDKDYQVLSALTFALGLSLLSGAFHISAALGAFIAGAVVRAFKQNAWVHESLEPFRVVFLAIFFSSIGTLVDLGFLQKQWPIVLLITVLSLLINTFINMFTLKLLGRKWRESFYSGALLSQLGEFTFVLAAIALNSGVINIFGYNTTLLTVFFTMLLTPSWISLANSLNRNFK